MRTCSFDVAVTVAVAVAVAVAQTGSINPSPPPPHLHSGHLPTIDLKVVGIRSGSQYLLIDDGDGNGDVQKNETVKASSTRIWIILKPDNFFSVLAFRPPIHKLRFPEPQPSTTTKKIIIK